MDPKIPTFRLPGFIHLSHDLLSEGTSHNKLPLAPGAPRPPDGCDYQISSYQYLNDSLPKLDDDTLADVWKDGILNFITLEEVAEI